MTVYRGMDIGTAKPTPAEQGGIPHHLIDIIDPWEPTSVSQYREWAKAAVDEVQRRGKQALFVGGTALYLKALLRGLFHGPGADVELRQGLEQVAEEHGDSALHHRLAALDPIAAARLHPHDRRRSSARLKFLSCRACRSAPSKPSTTNRRRHGSRSSRSSFREQLCMIASIAACSGSSRWDWSRKFVRLPGCDRPICPVAAEGIGYREVIAMLEGRASLNETIERVQARSDSSQNDR